MREIERVRSHVGPMRGPAIADLASESSKWAEEYLAQETHVQVSYRNKIFNPCPLLIWKWYSAVFIKY